MFAWMLLEAEGLGNGNVEVQLELRVHDGALNCFITSFIRPTALVILANWSSERLLLASCLTTSTWEMKFNFIIILHYIV
jgi:hypothetical protein